MTDAQILLATMVFGAASLYAATTLRLPSECPKQIEFVFQEPHVISSTTPPQGLSWPVEERLERVAAVDDPPPAPRTEVAPAPEADEPRPRHHRHRYRRWRR